MNRDRWIHRLRVVEAMALLAAAGLAQRAIPMRRWSWVLGRAAEVPPTWSRGAVEALPARPGSAAEWNVMRAVDRARRAVPWSPTCLAQVAAGQALLRQARTSGVAVIGLRPSTAPATPDRRWETHAWLLGRRGALTGGAAAEGFTATTVFERPGGLRASEVRFDDREPSPDPHDSPTRG